MTKNNDIQVLLEYAKAIEWQLIENYPFPIFDEKKWFIDDKNILTKNQYGHVYLCAYGFTQTGKSRFINKQTNCVEKNITHYMPLPNGNAGAVIRELLSAFTLIITTNSNTDTCIYCGLSKGEHKVICPIYIAQQALAKAAALIGENDDK